MIWGSGGWKSRLAKAAGAEPAGQMRDEKLHAVVARSTFRSQYVQNISASDHFWKLRCRKSARRFGAKHISRSKCAKHLSVGPLLEVEMSKKCTLLWREAHFEVKIYKTRHVRATFGCSDAVPHGTCKGLSILLKASKMWGFCGIWSIRSVGLLRWFCVTGAALRMTWHQFWRSTLDRWSRKIAKRIAARLSALHSTFHVWRKPHRIVLFLMLWSSKIEEVSQNCFVLDVVKFKKMKKSRRIVSFLTLI